LRGFEANPPLAADGREVSPFPHASEKLAGRPDGDNSGGKSIVSRSLRWIDAADRGGDAGRRPEGHPGRYRGPRTPGGARRVRPGAGTAGAGTPPMFPRGHLPGIPRHPWDRRPEAARRLTSSTGPAFPNCSSSVDPLSAAVDACPPEIVICRASKYPAPTKL